MIDHVLGRPSVKFRKIQVFAVLSFWSIYLYKGNRHGPPVLRRISALLQNRLTTWQSLVITLLWLYVARNFGKVVGLECPEPLANLYSRSYFRATWVTTALDAGFWSAMRIRRKWARDFLSLVFSVYYLICAEQADEKVRKVRGSLTVEHMRVSWNKGTTPYLGFLTGVLRPRLMRYPPRAIRIPRPQESSYQEPVQAWLYFDGPLSALKKQRKVVLDIPGGGFVAMNPRTHDDKLMAWAGKTGLPVLSLDYRKAPEFPYPYALNECYDVYHMIVSSRGRCLGLSGDESPKIVVAGDSAGGNLAVGMVLMILQAGSTDSRRWQGEQMLPPPEGVVLIYPSLDMNIGNWMTDEQMALIRDRRVRRTNQGILRRKSDDYRNLAPDTPHVSDDEEDANPPLHKSPSTPTTAAGQITSPVTAIHLSAAHTNTNTTAVATQDAQAQKPQPLKTRLAMSSMISYFNDRILTPEMMRAMIVLYIGPHNRPDFSTDYLLSPLLAPESLLAHFPKTYFLTGERDPLVDDTVIFAGRIRAAKAARHADRMELGLVPRDREVFWEAEHVEVMLIPGISHGFFQFISLFPEGWKYVFRCAKWMREIFERADADDADAEVNNREGHHRAGDYFSSRSVVANGAARAYPTQISLRTDLDNNKQSRHHRRVRTGESSGDDDRPLEMTFGRGSPPHKINTDAAPRARRRRAPGRTKSLVSLASEDDLMGRRMKSLATGLMGGGSGEEPPTP
ncbi:alpha/beta-hydrolase [Pseudovirgaria hyperparasitica]|uniref:Alpha/beta-hydrolase n=1 Tax=Pseudovirgaria hyperparasitica TaxID=470096 RepID=A0A6A6WEQ3_9PEZI|nr:alpha/beta-hydrolase [Pseudovirgaria hyperparasitica]KAF2760514.1 alpha/beta-hydrolase [Pseudovirgaria hyperparasitica]